MKPSHLTTFKYTLLFLLASLALGGCGTQHETVPLSGADLALAALGPVDASFMVGANDGEDVDVVWGRKSGNKCIFWDLRLGLDDTSKKLIFKKRILADDRFDVGSQTGNDVRAHSYTYAAFDGVRVFVPKGNKLVVRSLEASDCNVPVQPFLPILPLSIPNDYLPGQGDYKPNVSTANGYELMMKYVTR